MQKQFVAVMMLAFIIFGSILVFMVTATSPEKGLYSTIPFFLAVFVVLFSFSALISYLFRRKITNNELHYRNIKVSVRQALFLAIFVTTSLFLSSVGLLTWWDILLIAAALILLELFFESNKSQVKEAARI